MMHRESETMISRIDPARRDPQNRWLDIDEVRLISDLRIMHAKVAELYQVVSALKQRHPEGEIVRYADAQVLAEDIERMDEIYLWYVKLKDGRDQAANE